MFRQIHDSKALVRQGLRTIQAISFINSGTKEPHRLWYTCLLSHLWVQ